MSSSESSEPRVLLACDYFIRYQIGLANGLAANGWDPILLGRLHDHAFGGESGAMQRYLSKRLNNRRFVAIGGRVRDPAGWTSIPRVRREVSSLAPVITHVQTCVPNDPRLMLAARLRPRQYALTVHDVYAHPGDQVGPWHQRVLARALLANAGLIFVHAERIREQLLDRWPTRVPIVVVPHGIDGGDPSPLPVEPSVLFFGRISSYKGVSVLLDAMESVWLHRPETRLTIAGEGPLPPHQALADRRVRLLHRHIDDEEIPDLFEATSVVVLPYLEASQSGVGSLAKGFGRPLLASAVGGLPELLSDGSGGLVPPSDSGALAVAIDEMLGDRATLEKMAAAGLESARERAGWPMVARQTIDAYARYLNPSGFGPVRRR